MVSVAGAEKLCMLEIRVRRRCLKTASPKVLSIRESRELKVTAKGLTKGEEERVCWLSLAV